MINKRIEQEINKIYNEVFKKIFTPQRIVRLSNGNKRQIERAVMQLKNSDDYKKFAKEFAKKLAQQGLNRQRGIWRKYFKAAKEKHYVGLPVNFKDFEYKVMQNAIKENFKMIKSIPEEVLKLTEHKYIDTMIEQVAKGSIGRNTFKQQLTMHGVKNAKVIARTETAKLQTVITENRAKELGSIAYTWRSSNDKRTRPSHKAMNDVIVFWRTVLEEKPLLDKMYGNAGEFPNCRCDPHPIFDEDDLTKSNYRVYDYRTHSIISMSKQQLVQALKQGFLA